MMRIEQASDVERAEGLAAAVRDSYFEAGSYLRDRAGALAEMALSGDDTEREAAARAIFSSLVERLADSFDPAAITLYNRFFAQLLTHCRARDGLLDARLAGFGLKTEADIFARAQRLRTMRPADSNERAERFVVLSRVTLGADVAITSVIAARLRERFPSAEIVLLGSKKMAELFGGDPGFTFHEVSYSRAGTLIERIRSWLDVLEAVRMASEGVERCLIIDPDTRFTQLGLLPVCRDDRYLFFPSREYGAESAAPLAALTTAWLDEVLGIGKAVYPQVMLMEDDKEITGRLVSRLRRGSSRVIITINLGVGENPAKRLGCEFEKDLIITLLTRGAAIILDCGSGEDEERRAGLLLGELGRDGRPRVVEADETGLRSLLTGDSCDADLMVWRGRIGLLAGLISAGDVYVGYDSAGQHIAAALGVPCVDVFAGYSSRRMVDRWQPSGPAPVVVVDAAARTELGLAAEVADHALSLAPAR